MSNIKKLAVFVFGSVFLASCAARTPAEEKIIRGAAIGAVAGAAGAAVTGINLAHGVVIGAALGGAYQAFNYSQTGANAKYYNTRPLTDYSNQRQPSVSYYSPAPYRTPAYTYNSAPAPIYNDYQREQIERYRRVQATRNNQYILSAPVNYYQGSPVPYYYNHQAGGYVPYWGLGHYQ